MKIVRHFQSLMLPIGAGSLALLLGLMGWKREILRINVRSCGLPWSFRFQARWYYSAARDFLSAAFNCSGPPIHVRPRDLQKLEYLKREPTLFLTAHVHNWERLAAWMPRQGIPLLGAARALSSPLFDGLLTWIRARYGIPVVTRNILSGAQSHLRNGGCFGVLWDQHSPLSRRTAMFFGMPVAMDPLPEILLRRYRPRVVVGFLLPSGCFRLVEILDPGARKSPEVGPPPRVQEDSRSKARGGRQKAAWEATRGATQETAQGVAQETVQGMAQGVSHGRAQETVQGMAQGVVAQRVLRGVPEEMTPEMTRGMAEVGIHRETLGKPLTASMSEVAGEPNGKEPGSPLHPSSWRVNKEFQENPRSTVPIVPKENSTAGAKAEPGDETDLLLSHMARRYHRVLESVVLANPHLWYGFAHRRFKGALSYSSTLPSSPLPLPIGSNSFT